MILLCFLLISQLQEVADAPRNPSVFPHPVLDQRGGIIYAGEKTVYHWKPSLTKIAVDHDITGIFFSGTFYWIVGSYGKSSFFDINGNLLGQFADLGESWELQSATGSRPIVSFRSEEGLSRGQLYPPLGSQVSLKFSKPIRVETHAEFAKSTPRMLELSNEFPYLWVVEDKETFYVVDQLEPRVRIYDPEDRARELQQGWSIPDDKVSSVPLRLQKYAGMPKTFMDNLTPGLYKAEAAAIKIQEWWHSCGKIVFFGQLEQNHVIAYQIPEKKGQHFSGFHLGVQILGPAPRFGPIGPLLEIPESQSVTDPQSIYHVAGTFNGAVVVFFPHIQGNSMRPEIRRYRYAGEWVEEAL